MVSSAIMGIVGGAAQSIIGGYQTAKGLSEMKKLGPRPEYEIPGQVPAYINTAEQLAYEGLPKEQKMAFLREQQRSEAAMLYASGTLDAQLSGAAAAKIASADAIGDLYSKDAVARLQGRRSYMDALLVGAEYENEKYRQDLTTYIDKRDTAMSLIGAGTQNIVGGFDTAAGGITGGEGGGMKSAEAPDYGSQKDLGYNAEANKSMRQHEREVEAEMLRNEGFGDPRFYIPGTKKASPATAGGYTTASYGPKVGGSSASINSYTLPAYQ